MMTSQATRWFQISMSILLGVNLVPDGIVGPATIGTWQSLSPAQRTTLSSAAALLGLPQLEWTSDVQPAREIDPIDDPWLKASQLLPWFEEAEELFSVPVEHMTRLVRIEAAQRLSNGTLFFNIQSRMGSFHGLTQMGKLAWKDAQVWATHRGIRLPDFEDGRYDARFSILAAAAYNERWTRHHADAIGDDPSFAARYALHNQGPGFVKRAQRGLAPINYHGQSATARALLIEAAHALV